MRYVLALVCAAVAVGAGAIFVRLGLQAGMSPLQLALWRLALASAALGVWSFRRQESPAPFTRSERGLTLVAGICLAFHFVTWMTSLQYVSVARSTLLVCTTPVFAGLLGLVVPSMRPRREFWIGLAVAAAGTYLITSGSTRGPQGSGSFLQGDGMAIAGALLILPYLVISQHIQRTHRTGPTVTWIYASAGACLALVAAVRGELNLPPGTGGWLAVGGMALFPQLMGHTLFNWSLRHFTPGQVACGALLEPVFAALLAWMVFAERVTPAQGIGGAVLLAGVAVTLWKPSEETI